MKKLLPIKTIKTKNGHIEFIVILLSVVVMSDAFHFSIVTTMNFVRMRSEILLKNQKQFFLQSLVQHEHSYLWRLHHPKACQIILSNMPHSSQATTYQSFRFKCLANSFRCQQSKASFLFDYCMSTTVEWSEK